MHYNKYHVYVELSSHLKITTYTLQIDEQLNFANKLIDLNGAPPETDIVTILRVSVAHL